MWDLPGPGLEPVSPALAGRFLTTAPPGRSPFACFWVGLSVFFFLNCKSSLYILDTGPLTDRSFRSLIHFELIFVYRVGLGSSFILLHVDSQEQRRMWELWVTPHPTFYPQTLGTLGQGSQTPTCARHRHFWPQNQLGNFQNSNTWCCCSRF